MTSSFDDFALTVHPTTIGAVVVDVRGVLDLYSAPQVRDAVRAADADADAASRRVVVDLTAATFVDSSALAMLVSLHRDLRGREGRLVLVAGDDPGTRALELSGIARTIDVVSSRTAALVHLQDAAAGEPTARR